MTFPFPYLLRAANRSPGDPESPGERAAAGWELRAVRKTLGLSLGGMGRALGYQGSHDTVNAQINKYEAGKRPIPPWIARLVIVYGLFGIPDDLRPE